MNVVPRASQWGELIRPDRVHGSLYSDPAIFEAELQNIWYRTWVYVGHESEVPNANDYVVKSIGPQSVIMTRDEQGKVNLLLNRCSHRGNQVCSYDKGNARSFTCPFHSWTFANDGRLVGYAFPDGYEGQDKSKLSLGRVTRVQSHRGFVFGSFAAEGPTLEEHLGGRVGKQQAKVGITFQLDAAAVDQVVVGEVQQGGVELAIGEQRANALVAGDAIEAKACRWLEAGGATVAALLGALHPPIEVFRFHSELVLQNPARPQRGGLLILRYADALAFEIRGLVDAAVGAYPRAGVEKTPGGKNRQRDPISIAMGHNHEQRRQGHFRDVELLKMQLPPENLGRMRARTDEIDPVRLDRTIQHRTRPLVGPHNQTELQIGHWPSPCI